MKDKICVIIPAFNEGESIAKVIRDIPDFVHETIVVNNASTDNTIEEAQKAGARVLTENRKGYGWACLKGMTYLQENQSDTEIVVFLDGDYSDYPEQMKYLIEPIIKQDFDLVIGARSKALREKGSMTVQQVFGNWLATFLIGLFYGAKFTDLGPFRAIKFDSLLDLNMQDKTYGWTVEMQLKALRKKLKYKEVAVNYRKRIGLSKVSGTVKGTIGAGVKILTWIFKHAFSK